MPHSSERLLQLLQRFPNNPNHVQQIHSLLITEGHLLCNKKWKTTLLYNALIRTHLCFGQTRASLLLFTRMLLHQSEPNAHTFTSLIKATSSSWPSLGPPLHSQAFRRGALNDPFVPTSLVSFYAECGEIGDACKMFDEMPQGCVVSCNAMIHGFCRNGYMVSALCLFEGMPERDVVSWTSVVNGFRMNRRFCEAVWAFGKMVRCSVKPSEATYVSVLSSCVGLDGWGGLCVGKEIHGHIVRNENQLTAFMGTALIDLYGKSGLLNAAENVFDQVVGKEVCCWNAMISALSSNGREKEALDLFERMKREGLKPNEVTFVAVLTACARGKLVEYGLQLFRSMSIDFGIVPVMEHYGCVADLLGRAGLLREATKFVKRMPFEPDASVLGALLGASKIHGTRELGNEVGQKLIDMQPQHSGRYIVLSNINAAMQRWDRAADLRKMMLNAGVQKTPAYSVIT